MFSFLRRRSRCPIVTAAGADAAAPRVLAGLLRELPELLLACVVEAGSGNILASYTTHASLNPNHLSLRHAKLLHTVQQLGERGLARRPSHRPDAGAR